MRLLFPHHTFYRIPTLEMPSSEPEADFELNYLLGKSAGLAETVQASMNEVIARKGWRMKMGQVKAIFKPGQEHDYSIAFTNGGKETALFVGELVVRRGFGVVLSVMDQDGNVGQVAYDTTGDKPRLSSVTTAVPDDVERGQKMAIDLGAVIRAGKTPTEFGADIFDPRYSPDLRAHWGITRYDVLGDPSSADRLVEGGIHSTASAIANLLKNASSSFLVAETGHMAISDLTTELPADLHQFVPVGEPALVAA